MTDTLSPGEIHDSDILEMEKVYRWMVDQQHKRRDLENFRREIIERFHQAGFVVNVLTYNTTEPEVYSFEVEVLRKVERKAFDYDKQVHEVVNNLLDLPDQAGGWIKADEGMKEAAKRAKEHKH